MAQTLDALEPGNPGLLVGRDTLDEALVDRVVEEIAEVHMRMGLVYHLTLGRLLMDRFFGGNTQAYDACSKRHASFRALARREDLPVSHVSLYNAIAVYRQYADLPKNCRDRLPMAHHKALLPLKDNASRAALASRAAEEAMTVVELRRLVAGRRELEKSTERRGRPRMLAMQKTLRWVERTLGDSKNLLGKEDAAGLPDEELQVLANAAEVGLRTLEEVRQKIQSTLDERGIQN